MEVEKDKSSVSSQSTTSDETAAAVEKKRKSNQKSIKAFYNPVKLRKECSKPCIFEGSCKWRCSVQFCGELLSFGVGRNIEGFVQASQQTYNN